MELAMNEPRVLMFGWEFPPILYGGLGVACLGLCEALAPYVQLKMIIPKSTAGQKLQNAELIGLNNIDPETLQKEVFLGQYPSGADIFYIESEVLPYPSESFHRKKKTRSLKNGGRWDTSETWRAKPFEIEDLYGENVIEKVHEFADYAVRLALKMDFDIIHVHDWMTFLAGIKIKMATGKPLVAHVHSLEFDRNGPESRNWMYHIERQAMEHADVVIPVSYYTSRIIEKYYGIEPSKIIPIHNGTTRLEVEEHERRFPEPVVIFLGRVTRQKGPGFFVDVAARVLQYVPEVRFVLAGGGDMLEKLIELVAERGISDRFHFTGFIGRDKVKELLAITDVYCLPSVSEPFGLSAVEAAEYEIPCIISQRSGVSEVLHGSLKADFWDVDKMANDIIALLKSKTLRQQLVSEASDNLQHVTWQKTAEKVLSVYKQLLN